MVGLEGLWGCIAFAILLPIFETIECTGVLCHNGYLENTSQVFEDFRNHPELLAMALAQVCSIACFNACGVSITKYASAA